MSPKPAAPISASQIACRQHVGVGMPVKPPLVGDLDAADHELAAGDERVHVEALADPHRVPPGSDTTVR